MSPITGSGSGMMVLWCRPSLGGLATRALASIPAAPAYAIVIASVLAAIPAALLAIAVIVPACIQQIMAFPRSCGKAACS